MGPSTVLLAFLCLSGVDAAALLHNAAKEKQPTLVSGLLDNAAKMQQNPQVQTGEKASGGSFIERTIAQLVFGVLYYFLIVTKYPMLNKLEPTKEAKDLQAKNEVEATCHTSLPVCLLSWCCTGPRAAHTFHSAGVMDYWAGCVLMSLAPCCTLWAVNSFTDLNDLLGGEKKSILMGALCACCCSCCVVAQDAQSLDLITGAKTVCCGVETPQEESPENAA